jgi:hydrogenase maturation protease
LPRPILVIGLGHALMRDEGIGCHLLRALQAQADRYPDVEFLDLGTSGLSIIHAIAGRRKTILVDCALMGEEPGAIRRFSSEDARSGKDLPGLSTHEGDLLALLATARALGAAPEEIVIFGIQPADISPGEHLSPGLSSRLPHYLAAICLDLPDPRAPQ